MQQQLADLTLAEVEDLVPVLAPVLVPPHLWTPGTVAVSYETCVYGCACDNGLYLYLSPRLSFYGLWVCGK